MILQRPRGAPVLPPQSPLRHALRYWAEIVGGCEQQSLHRKLTETLCDRFTLLCLPERHDHDSGKSRAVLAREFQHRLAPRPSRGSAEFRNDLRLLPGCGCAHRDVDDQPIVSGSAVPCPVVGQPNRIARIGPQLFRRVGHP